MHNHNHHRCHCHEHQYHEHCHPPDKCDCTFVPALILVVGVIVTVLLAFWDFIPMKYREFCQKLERIRKARRDKDKLDELRHDLQVYLASQISTVLRKYVERGASSQRHGNKLWLYPANLIQAGMYFDLDTFGDTVEVGIPLSCSFFLVELSRYDARETARFLGRIASLEPIWQHVATEDDKVGFGVTDGGKVDIVLVRAKFSIAFRTSAAKLIYENHIQKNLFEYRRTITK